MTSSHPSALVHLAPGIWCLALKTATLLPATHTNCYLVGDADFVVIDPGSLEESERALLANVIDAFITQDRRFRAIILTHHHPDHVDGVAPLQTRYDVPVWSHRRCAEQLDTIRVDRELDDEQIIDLGKDSLRCLHTPGHASGHLCLHHARTNSLLGGDLVASEGTIVISPPDGDMGDYLASLERVRQLGAVTIFPAHGTPIGDPDALLGQYIDHRHAREALVLDALRRHTAADANTTQKPVTPMDLVPEVYQEIPTHIWPLAAHSLLAHLIHLVERGVAHRDGTKFWA